MFVRIYFFKKQYNPALVFMVMYDDDDDDDDDDDKLFISVSGLLAGHVKPTNRGH